MSMKENWEFPYLVKDLLSGAQSKQAHHQSRLDWWAKRRDETEERLLKEGVTIDKSMADPSRASGKAASISNAYSRQPQVTLDAEMTRDLSECNSKIYEHQVRVDTYSAWVEVLAGAKQDQSYPLNQDDWLFFFGRSPVTGSEA